MQYTLVISRFDSELEKFVNENLKRGWKLKGETFTARRTEYEVGHLPKQYDIFCQAMVKYDKGEKEE